MFRNEAHALVEWIEHYILHGAEHFYLIDDDSDDNSCEVIQKYIDSGVVTLYKVKWDRYYGRQHDMYNTYFIQRIREKTAHWFLLCDLDEFVWSPKYINLCEFLDQIPHIAQAQFEQVVYGSNGHITQPKSIVAGFTKRTHDIPSSNPGARKYFVNSDYEFQSINIHYATFVDKSLMDDKFICYGPEWIIMNHYCCQSKTFWITQKCSRGDSDDYRRRVPEDMAAVDINDVEDLSLLKQNMDMYIQKGII